MNGNTTKRKPRKLSKKRQTKLRKLRKKKKGLMPQLLKKRRPMLLPPPKLKNKFKKYKLRLQLQLHQAPHKFSSRKTSSSKPLQT
jgi:hypothetical protein